MNKNILILLSILIFTTRTSLAQITLREYPQNQAISKPIGYDSTCFWYYPFNNKYEIKKYIGQKIYVLPFSRGFKSYETTVSEKPPINNNNSFSSSQDPEDILNGLTIEFDSDASRYLTILDAYSSSDIDWYLKLLLNERDTIFYINSTYKGTNGKNPKDLPFVLPDFIEKSKKQFLGKKFVALGDRTSVWVIKGHYAIEANTRAKMDMTYGEKWTCVDVTLVDLEEQFNHLYIPLLVFRNSKGNEIFVNYVKYIDWIRDTREYEKFYYAARCTNIDEFESLENFELTEKQKQEKQKLKEQEIAQQKLNNIERFGDYYGNLVNENKVVIGMSKEICLRSWGPPILKNTTTTENKISEVWIYGFKTYLFFENNTLKIINQ